MESWQYLNQDVSHWPRWLWFANWGRREDGMLIIHSLMISHRILPGDWIDRRPDGELTIRKEVE